MEGVYRKVMIFVIPGEPVPKHRPRVTMKGGKAWAYTPEDSRTYAQTVKLIMLNNQRKGLIQTITKPTPVVLRLHFHLTSKVTHTPDIINLAAQIADCLEGICYANDSQVVELICKKSQSTNPRVHLEVLPAPVQRKSHD
jgi:Holliday junction resolvase RusA-like endonuclease